MGKDHQLPRKSKVDQSKVRRSGIGLRGYDEDLAYDGYTLFWANAGDGTVYLIDMLGNIENIWKTGYRPGLGGILTESGTLFYNGRTEEDSERYIASQPWKGGIMMEFDWDGNLLWQLEHPDHHHWGIPLKNGNVMFISLERLDDEFARQIQGGRPGTEFNGEEMYGDTLIEMTRTGDIVWEWKSSEHLEPEQFPLVGEQIERDEWTHMNSVYEMDDGNLVLSFRNLSSVIIIDRQSGEVLWHLGPPTLAQQHAPVPVGAGNLLIFDNGTHRADDFTPFSRVLEVNIETKEIVWSYQEKYTSDFFSPLISNATRLPNGNTLICEGTFGRLFEVIPEGEVVWEYVNPFFFPLSDEPDAAISNRCFRCYRYSEEMVDLARQTSTIRR